MEDELEEKNKKAFKDIKNDYSQAKKAKKEIDLLITAWNDAYYGKSKKTDNKTSQIVMKEIAKHIEWVKPAITEPFTESSNPIRLSITNGKASSRVIEKYCNYQFVNEFDRTTFMTQLADVMLREGTVWVKDGWKFKSKKTTTVMTADEIISSGINPYKIENSDEEGKFKVTMSETIQNAPTAEVIRNEYIFPDPSARIDDEIRFVIIKKFQTMSDLKELGTLSEEKLSKIETAMNETDKNGSTLSSTRDDEDKSYGYDSEFKTLDKPRQKVAILEYWGYYDLNGDGVAEPIVATWTEDGTELSIEENPYPVQKIPFNRAVFSARAFSLWGNSLAFLLEDNQIIKSGIMRGIMNNISLSNNGVKFIQRGSIDYINMKRLRNGEKYIITDKAPSEAMQDGNFNVLPAVVFNVMDKIDSETSQLSGVTPNGNAPALNGGKSSDDNGSPLTMSQQRMSATVRNISNLLMKVMTSWVSNARRFLDNEQIEALFTEQEQVDYGVFEENKNVKIKVKVGTGADKLAKLREINLLLQQSKVLGELAPRDSYSTLVAEMYELFDMYDEANKLRDYKAEPSPKQQQMAEMEVVMKQLEIEEMKLKLQELQSKVMLNQATAQAKAIDAQAGATYKEAQTYEKVTKAKGHEVDTTLKPVDAIAKMGWNKNKQQGV